MSITREAGARQRLYESSEVVTVSDGDARLSLRILRRAATGAGRRRLVLLHGNPSHLDHWSQLLPALRQYGEVLAFDHPGFGQSGDFEDGVHTLERSALVVIELLDAVGWTGPVDVIGQSHGGLVAIALAALHPERVASIVGLGSGGTPAHPAYRALAGVPLLAAVLPALAKAVFRPRVLRPLARFFLERGSRDPFAPASPPAWVVEDQLRDLAERPEVLGAMVRLAQDDPCRKVVDYARRVEAPTLFIHGAHDKLVNVAYARRLFDVVAQANSTARFVEVDGGHMVHLTHPERVAAVLGGWFRATANAKSEGRLVG